MKKAILMPFAALLLLLMATPVLARSTKTPFAGTMTVTGHDPPIKEWMADGIWRIKQKGYATISAGVLSGEMEYIEDLRINTHTGRATVTGKWVMKVDDVVAFSGTFVGELLIDGEQISGSGMSVGCGVKGTAYEGKKMRGTFSGSLPVLFIEGEILIPKS